MEVTMPLARVPCSWILVRFCLVSDRMSLISSRVSWIGGWAGDEAGVVAGDAAVVEAGDKAVREEGDKASGEEGDKACLVFTSASG